MKNELVRQPMRLSHFSPQEGGEFLRERLRERTANPPNNPTLEESQRARDASHLRVADRFIQYVINTAIPHRKNRVDLLNETTLLAPDPERALAVIEANGSINERLKFEMVRKMLLAGIASDIEARSIKHQIRRELYDVHNLLDQKLFSGTVGETWTTATYAVHSRTTNQLKSVHDTYPLFVKPTERVKKFVQESRYVEGVGYVLSSVREKSQESSTLKVLRRAVQQRESTGNDLLDTLGVVKDSMGLMFVVKGTMHSTDPKVGVLKEKVVALLKERYGEVEVKQEDANGSKKVYPGQTTHANYQRVKVQVASMPIPFELIFYGEGDYINDTYNVGKRNRKTKQYSGNSHRIFEIERIRQILPIIYPKSVDGHSIKAYEGLDKEAIKTLRVEARKLRKEKRVPVVKGVIERVTSRRHKEHIIAGKEKG